MHTVKEIATKLTVSQGVVYKEIALGKLRCYRIGAAIRISAEQLQEYLDRNMSSATPKQSKRQRLDWSALG